MSLVKRTYVDQVTVIPADNLNDIQDEIIQNASDISDLQEVAGDGSLSGFTATDLTGAANELKGDVSDVKNTLKGVWYRSLMDALYVRVPFEAKTGDSVTFKTVGGENFTVAQIMLERADGTTKAYYMDSSQNSRTISITDSDEVFTKVWLNMGQVQPVYAINNTSYYNWHDSVDYLLEGVKDAAFIQKLTELYVYKPFYAKAGDSVTFKTVGGENFSVAQIWLKRADETTKAYYLDSSKNTRTVTVESGDEFFYAVLSMGSVQDIYIINETSFYNWKTPIEALSEDVDNIGKTVLGTKFDIELGAYSSITGEKQTATNFARSITYVKKTMFVDFYQGYWVGLLAYDWDDTFVGTWDGSKFKKEFDQSVLHTRIDVSRIAYLYPNYKFKLHFKLRSDQAIDIPALLSAMNVYDMSAGLTPNYVPAYYDSYLATKCASVSDNINSVGKNGETFIFITDIHWETNWQRSPVLVKHILNNTNVRLLICGGDLINTQEKNTAINTLSQCISAFKNDIAPMHIAFGNHDANSLNWVTTELMEENMFSDAEVFGIIQKPSSYTETHQEGDAINYYFDRTDSKTRFIILDSGVWGSYASGTLNALYNMLISTPDGYKIVIVEHWFVSGPSAETATLSSDAIKLMNVISAYNNRGMYSDGSNSFDFNSASGEIVCVVGGHTHYDYVLAVDDADNVSGVPFIATSDDSYRDRTATPVTIDEQCFDVITLDYSNKKVKCVRIGQGTDRIINL